MLCQNLVLPLKAVLNFNQQVPDFFGTNHTYTMALNIFSILPYDVKRGVISEFLDPLSRAEWNQVLHKEERVFKRFSSNDVIQHHIATTQTEYNRIKSNLDHHLDRAFSGSEYHIYYHSQQAFACMRELFQLFCNRMNVVMFTQKGFKEDVLTMIQSFIENDIENLYIDFESMAEISREAETAMNIISSIPPNT